MVSIITVRLPGVSDNGTFNMDNKKETSPGVLNSKFNHKKVLDGSYGKNQSCLCELFSM